MTRRGAVGHALALVGCGTLLLAATQPWVLTVTEVAPGAPRTRGSVAGGDLVPWLAPVAGVAALAVVAVLSGMRWGRPVAAVAALTVLVGALRTVAVVAAGRPAGAGTVVSATPTGWLSVGVAAALVTAAGAVLGWRQDGPAPPREPVPDPHDADAGRRRDAAHWRDLSEGIDPTDS